MGIFGIKWGVPTILFVLALYVYRTGTADVKPKKPAVAILSVALCADLGYEYRLFGKTMNLWGFNGGTFRVSHISHVNVQIEIKYIWFTVNTPPIKIFEWYLGDSRKRHF